MNPTIQIHKELQEAFDFFNERLFDNELPLTLMTLQRGKRTYGYFSPNRFTNAEGEKISELAMNPDYFGARTLVDTLSTVVHEMVHVWHFFINDKPCRMGYHDKVWGEKMEELGLMPSNTGMEGGKKTGQQMTHYIMEGGKFSKVVFELIERGFDISWYDTFGADLQINTRTNTNILNDWKKQAGGNDELVEKLTQIVSKKNEPINPEDEDNNDDDEFQITVTPPSKGAIPTRLKYSCSGCGANVWGKPNLNIQCGDCSTSFELA